MHTASEQAKMLIFQYIQIQSREIKVKCCLNYRSDVLEINQLTFYVHSVMMKASVLGGLGGGGMEVP